MKEFKKYFSKLIVAIVLLGGFYGGAA